MTERQSDRVLRAAGRTGLAGTLAMMLAAGTVSAEPALPQSAACPAWTHAYTMHLSSASSVMLPTNDGGIVLVGDLGEIDFGEKLVVHDDWRVVAVKFDRCGRARYATPVGPKESDVAAAALDAEGSLYVAAAAAGNHSWVAKVDRDGRQLWLRQYASRHSGIVGLHPGRDGCFAMLADVSTGFTVGDRTFKDPETADGTIIIPAIPFLIVIDANGRMTYSESFDRSKRFLLHGRDRFYLATHLGTGPGSGDPDDIEARSNQGGSLWHLKLDLGGEVAIDPKGGLVQFADSYVDCGRAWYDCPLEKRERVAIDEAGKISSRVVVEGSGKTPFSRDTVRRFRSANLRLPLKGLPHGQICGVDGDGRALIDNVSSAGYAVLDEQGRIADIGTVPGLHPSRDRGVRHALKWASDGAAFALYFKSKNPMTFHLVKWTPRR